MAERIPQSSGNSPGGGGLALRFISGKYQGGEFPLEGDREIYIGRSSDLEMVLVEEMVSRKHARVTVRGGEITIEDLGSTNGTFVNGEKIERATLKEGDRVLIGTSILKVVVVTASQASLRVPSGGVMSAPRRTVGGTDEGPRMSGAIEEVPLPDLMQLFGTSRKSGVLVVTTEHSTGRLYLKQGIVHYAAIDSSPDLPALKAIYRMLGWERGLFQLDPPEERVFDSPLDLPVQEILMEALRQQDEFNVIRERLPAPEVPLMLSVPLVPKLSALSEHELDVLQLAVNSPDLAAVMDLSARSDLETGQILSKLLSQKYLTSAE
ncbi:MAG: DUF4388 domain-containing protein [Polyangiaceae bacterium]|nr:DUF4388 domain-containing protein [Polyangiaceae bacterium]MCW5792646.1 DUF4388 domain-containing protein [Polyangiaceae bacterium]